MPQILTDWAVTLALLVLILNMYGGIMAGYEPVVLPLLYILSQVMSRDHICSGDRIRT